MKFIITALSLADTQYLKLDKGETYSYKCESDNDATAEFWSQYPVNLSIDDKNWKNVTQFELLCNHSTYLYITSVVDNNNISVFVKDVDTGRHQVISLYLFAALLLALTL